MRRHYIKEYPIYQIISWAVFYCIAFITIQVKDVAYAMGLSILAIYWYSEFVMRAIGLIIWYISQSAMIE